MKLEDYVKQSIVAYPILYLDKTYELSRLKVLNQIFLVLGNGMEWAWTKDPSKGGYMVDPVVKKVKGEWIRQHDLPYGKATFNSPNFQRYFEEPLIEILKVDHSQEWGFYDWYSKPVWKGFFSDIPESFKGKCVTDSYYFSKGKYYLVQEKSTLDLTQYLNTADPEYVLKNRLHSLNYSLKPYPFCTKYWPIDEIDIQLIKPDWRQGIIDIFEYALAYYQRALYGSEEMCEIWKREGFDSIITKYADKGVDVLLEEYGMTYQNLPEFLGIDLKTVNAQEYGEIMKKAKYEKERLGYIAVLEDRLPKLR